MNRHILLVGLLAVVCLATLCGVWGQRSQLAGLKAEQQRLIAQQAARTDGAASPGTAAAAEASAATTAPALVVTPELLRLRNEVTRLTERRHELAGARAENEQLRAQLASRGTNATAATPPPPGYVRKAEARMAGHNTPEDTIQSLLWAFQSHDFTNLLQAFPRGAGTNWLVLRDGKLYLEPTAQPADAAPAPPSSGPAPNPTP